jgi:predicted nicotinamide N-methyase
MEAPAAEGSPQSYLPPGYGVARTRISCGPLRVELFRVADPNALSDSLDPAAFAEDERFPYWAEVWPSGIALAAFLARRDLGPSTPAVELGCGVGLAGVAAALRGATVLFTDFDPDALAFARANHALNLGSPGATRLLDWREPPADLSAPLVLAADVLYERRFLGAFLATLAAVVSPGGVAFVAEPGRRVAEGTVEGLERAGFERDLHLEELEWDGRNHAIWIHELRRRRTPSRVPPR